MSETRDSAIAREGADALPQAAALLARWNLSLAAFYLRRWQRQLELPLKLIRIASPGDALEVHRAFQEDLRTDYIDQVEALRHACLESGTAAAPADLAASYGAELLRAQEHARQLIEQAKTQAERILASVRGRAAVIVAEARAEAQPRRAVNE